VFLKADAKLKQKFKKSVKGDMGCGDNDEMLDVDQILAMYGGSNPGQNYSQSK